MGAVVDPHIWWLTPSDVLIICATSSLFAFFLGLMLGGWSA